MSTAIQSGFFSRRLAVCLCCGWMLALPAVVFGQTNYYATNGTEYPIVGALPGDQVHPDVAVTPTNGFVVWQDNVTDGDGWGVSAMQLNGTLSGSGSSFRVNVQGAGDQENPRVALLQGGGAVFVWQGGVEGLNQHIYARFLVPANSGAGYVWLNPGATNDMMVNTFTNNFQANPAVATLTDGNVIIVWASFDEAGSASMQDVYGRIFSPTGVPVTGEFLINQFTSYNQRTPTVAALANGGYVVAWVSEQERSVAAPGSGLTPSQMSYPSVDIYARIYDNTTNALGDEFLVNSDFNPCADPDVAAGSDGGFMITWDARDMTSPFNNGLDIYERSYTSAGVGGTVMRVNSYLYGDQYAPRISSLGTDYLIVWMSLTPQQGIYGQFLRENGLMVGSQIQVSTPAALKNIQPVVASDGVGQFLAVWTGFTGLQYSYDLLAQRYLNTQQPLEPLPAPFVYAPFVLSSNVYQPQLVVSWPPVPGLSISNYSVYVNGLKTPMAVITTNVWTMTAADGLTVGSSNYFQVGYTTTDGRQSPLSPAAGGSTWSGINYYGIPYEWLTNYYGLNIANWPANVNAPLAPGGLSLMQVFLSGGDPTNSATWLRTDLSNTQEGLFLSWNPQPGFTYQVQMTTNLTTWTNLGAPRFAADTTDSIFVGKSSAGYYRILLLRQ